MLTAVRIINWIARVAGVGALLLGVTFWITGLNITAIHMLFGVTLALSFLVLSIIMVATRGMRLLGVAGIIYALILPVFGLSQFQLQAMLGGLFWLIQVAHLLVGLGALTLIQVIYTRYERLKRPVAEQAAAQKAVS
jgi:hypothetical protein